MENFKVRVSNEAESKEVQGLFEQLGFELVKCDRVGIVAVNDGEIYPDFIDNWDEYEGKELTIQQLSDLVVLHRNDVSDANYIHQKTGLKYFVTAMNDYYFWSGKWEESYDVFSIENLKPITNQKTIGKIPYLVKTIDKWEEQQLTSDTPESATCLRIPDGAIELLYSESNNSKYHFVKLNGDLMSVTDILDGKEYWYKDKLKYKNWDSVSVVWQRTPTTMHTPTQPEELPFIDDEPKMADIEQTLNERQSQYGSFEDVATVTQDLLAILERTGLKSLPKPHKEALHMICSKMARIVNGDFDYIENWHDIAGYATLMERDLKTKDGATNSKVVRTRVINGIMQEI